MQLTFCIDFTKPWVFLIGQEKDQRSLDLNTAKCMLGLLLGKTWPLFPVFNQFLEVRAMFRNCLYKSMQNRICLIQRLFIRLFQLQFCIDSKKLWCCIIPQQSKYKVINKDQWCNVLEFSRTINLDLSNYDEDGACE